MTTIAELTSSLVDARADVTSIRSVLAEAQRIADARTSTSTKAAADLNAALEAQSKAERVYADAQNDANANAMLSADRDVRVKTLRRDAAVGEVEKAQDSMRGAQEALDKAIARVSSLEQRIEIEKDRIAASADAVHQSIDGLALKAAAISEDLLEVVAEIASKLDAAARAAERYTKATGEPLRAVDRQHAFLAVVEDLAARAIIDPCVKEILTALEGSSSVTPAAQLVNGIEQALRSAPVANPERVAERRRFLSLAREHSTHMQAVQAHQRTEEDRHQKQGAASRAETEAKTPAAWTSGAARFFKPGGDALARQRAMNEEG